MSRKLGKQNSLENKQLNHQMEMQHLVENKKHREYKMWHENGI